MGHHCILALDRALGIESQLNDCVDAEQGLALLDALSGDGGAFWAGYADSLLPQPKALSLPCTLPPELLTELQHPAIINGAIKQQACCPAQHAEGLRIYTCANICDHTQHVRSAA